MEFTKLGNTGMTVSRICLGCMSYGETKSPDWARQREWAVGAEEAREHFAIALDAGINFSTVQTPIRRALARRSPGDG